MSNDTTELTSSDGRLVRPGDPEWEEMHKTHPPLPGDNHVREAASNMYDILEDLDYAKMDLSHWIMTHSVDERRVKEMALERVQHCVHMCEEVVAYLEHQIVGLYDDFGDPK
jgi:hypothetical protein